LQQPANSYLLFWSCENVSSITNIDEKQIWNESEGLQKRFVKVNLTFDYVNIWEGNLFPDNSIPIPRKSFTFIFSIFYVHNLVSKKKLVFLQSFWNLFDIVNPSFRCKHVCFKKDYIIATVRLRLNASMQFWMDISTEFSFFYIEDE
jgi:hypothetical protein